MRRRSSSIILYATTFDVSVCSIRGAAPCRRRRRDDRGGEIATPASAFPGKSIPRPRRFMNPSAICVLVDHAPAPIRFPHLSLLLDPPGRSRAGGRQRPRLFWPPRHFAIRRRIFFAASKETAGPGDYRKPFLRKCRRPSICAQRGIARAWVRRLFAPDGTDRSRSCESDLTRPQDQEFETPCPSPSPPRAVFPARDVASRLALDSNIHNGQVPALKKCSARLGPTPGRDRGRFAAGQLAEASPTESGSFDLPTPVADRGSDEFQSKCANSPCRRAGRVQGCVLRNGGAARPPPPRRPARTQPSMRPRRKPRLARAPPCPLDNSVPSCDAAFPFPRGSSPTLQRLDPLWA